MTIFVGTVRHRDRKNASVKMIKYIWVTAVFYFESTKIKKQIYIVPEVIYIPLSSFLLSVHMNAHSSLIFLSLSLCLSFMLALSLLYLQVSLKKQWRGKPLHSPRLRPFTNPVPMRVSQQASETINFCVFYFPKMGLFLAVIKGSVSHSVYCIVKLPLKNVLTVVINNYF